MSELKKIRKPDFFIVGAAKAGTTALYDFLSQHPEIYMSPIKEPNYFAKDINPEIIRQKVKERLEAEDLNSYFNSGMKRVLHRAYLRNENTYLKLFEAASADKAAGEASPSYLYSSLAAREIHAYCPEARIIIILRQPAQRAYSHYLMDLKLGFTSESFSEALENDKRHTPKGWGANSLYRELGSYYAQVKRYLDIFPQEQVHIVLQEELIQKPSETLRQIFRFLGVNEHIQIHETGLRNESMVPSGWLASILLRSGSLRIKVRNLLKDSYLKKLLLRCMYKKPSRNAEDETTIRMLTGEYRTDIEKLSVLIKRDLSQWLK